VGEAAAGGSAGWQAATISAIHISASVFVEGKPEQVLFVGRIPGKFPGQIIH